MQVGWVRKMTEGVILMSKLLFDKGGTLSSMCTLLEMCGLNLNEFEEHSYKMLADLWGEIQRNEIYLLFDLKNKKVTRVARSVRLLITTQDGGCFLETKRKYLSKGGRVVRKRRPWSVSGTCMRIIDPKNPDALPMPEDPIQTVIRETKEELNHDIPKEEIESRSVTEEEDSHPSSVFHGLDSHVFFRRYRWAANQPLRRRMFAVKDNGVIAYVEYFNRWPQGLKENWADINLQGAAA